MCRTPETEESDDKGESIFQRICNNVYVDRMCAILGTIVYGTIHSFIMTIEMFTLHVVLTSSTESIYSFLFYNNFAEVKITVFKKCDLAGLFQYAINDGVERFHLLIYLTNIFATTSQNKE